MSSNTDKRNFIVRENSEEKGKFTGSIPRDAALKVARRKADVKDTEKKAKQDTTEIRLRETGTEKEHVYEGWAWETEPPTNAPDWLGDTVKESNVSKVGVNHLDDE